MRLITHRAQHIVDKLGVDHWSSIERQYILAHHRSDACPFRRNSYSPLRKSFVVLNACSGVVRGRRSLEIFHWSMECHTSWSTEYFVNRQWHSPPKLARRDYVVLGLHESENMDLNRRDLPKREFLRILSWANVLRATAMKKRWYGFCPQQFSATPRWWNIFKWKVSLAASVVAGWRHDMNPTLPRLRPTQDVR